MGNVSARKVVGLSMTAGLLAMVSAAVGLLWGGPGGAETVVNLHGQTVALYGRGLYRNDTLLAAGNNWGSDLVTLFLGLPLLVLSAMLYAKGSLRGRFVLLGTLGYFLYIGASYALGAVAYNEMFLVYVAQFSAALFAFLVVFRSFTPEVLAAGLPPDMPRRWPGAFLIASGAATLVIWMTEPVAALLAGNPPASLETRTTLFTHALDIAVIVPAALTAGFLILKRRPFGYVIAFSLLILEAMLMPVITIATIVQLRLGITFPPGAIVGPIAGFSVLAVLSLWVIASLLRPMRALPAGPAEPAPGR